ncbi:MAG: CHAT domain-containing protein [Acidobacteriota bacterium]|nr:CHAT domain-containing protein [Blastocatellia bacterium]MDW8239451.1 CHAT domain-containing protein [Acidobacteriota bacterium]
MMPTLTTPSRTPELPVEALLRQVLSQDDAVDAHRLLSAHRAYITVDWVKRLKEQVAHLIRVDIHQAIRLAELTQAAATLIDQPDATALAHHAVALVRHFSGRYREALLEYDQAESLYHRLNRPVDAARIGRAKLDVLMYLGRYEEALTVGQRACQVFRHHDQRLLLAQTLENMGNVYHRLDRYHEALSHYQQALSIYQEGGHQFNIGSVSYNTANVYVCLNQFEQAVTLYQQAREVYERLSMPLLVNQADYSIAWLYFQRGRFQESLRLFAEVRLQACQLGDPAQDALCDLDLAEVYWQLNAYQQAREAAQSAIEKFQALDMRYEQLKARMYLGIVHLRENRLDAAASELAAARQGFLAEGNDVFAAVTALHMSEVCARRQEWDQAESLCQQAEALFEQHRLVAKAAYAQFQHARIAFSSGDVARARSLSEAALTALGRIEAPSLAYQILHFLGNLLEQTGEADQAYRYYTRAVEQVERLRRGIRVEQLACAFIHDKMSVYEDLVQWCSQRETDDMIEAAFRYAEASKSRVLLDLLSQTGRTIERVASNPGSRDSFKQIETLRERLNWYYTRIEQIEWQGKQSMAGRLAELYAAARADEEQIARLIQQLRIEDAEAASLYSSFSLDVGALRDALADDEALVEYYIVNGRVKVFVLTRRELHLLNDITTDERVSSLLRPLRHSLNQCMLGEAFVHAHRRNRQAFADSCLKKLYTELIAPIESLIEGKRLVFVPHGLLHSVPFHALYDGHRYLLDHHEISYAPSASVFKWCVDKARARQKAGPILLMGLADDAAPCVTDEVTALKALWPEAKAVLGPDATWQRLLCDGSRAGLLHLATHATFRSDQPLFSAMKLADRWVSFYDLLNLRLEADLVTLSACETGLNGVYPGDELFGLTRGFLYAGASSLIVSSWMVKDRSTATFMPTLYEGLKQGLNKRAALRAAQLAMKQQHPHPYYWAPFVLIGAAF